MLEATSTPTPRADGKEAISDSLNVLIVDDEGSTRTSAENSFQEAGVRRENIFTAENGAKALDILLAKLAEGSRGRIHFLLCGIHFQGKDEGVVLMEEVFKGMGEENRPYIVAMSGKDQSPDLTEKIRPVTDNFLSKRAQDFLTKIQGEIIRAREFAEKQRGAPAPSKGGEKEAGNEKEAPLAQGGGEAQDHRSWVVVPSGEKTYYDKKEQWLDPTKPNIFYPHTLMVLSDGDGTLVPPFVMQRFVHHLIPYLPQLRDGWISSPAQKRVSEQWQKKLEKAIEKVIKLETTKEYPPALSEMDEAYMRTLQDLPVDKVSDIANEFVKEEKRQVDEKNRIYPFSKPLVRMLKYMGVVPLLVTGMPDIVVEGYMQELGIEALCFPLELNPVIKNGQRVFGEVIKNESGQAQIKLAVSQAIANAGYKIVSAFGDQTPDLNMLSAAMENKWGVPGRGFFMLDANNPKAPGHINDILNSYGDQYKSGKLVTLDKNLNPDYILRRVLGEFAWMEKEWDKAENERQMDQEARERVQYFRKQIRHVQQNGFDQFLQAP